MRKYKIKFSETEDGIKIKETVESLNDLELIGLLQMQLDIVTKRVQEGSRNNAKTY